MTLKIILIAIIAYAFGNLSFAVVIGKIFYKKDVRNYGSGNAGTTNMIRAFGKKAGIITFVGDALKGFLAALIGMLVGGEMGGYVAGAFVIVGHNWPLALKFKGGKGVATTIGVMLFVLPVITVICFVIGLSIAMFTRTVSLGSLIGVGISPLVILIFYKPFDFSLFIFSLFYTSLCLFKHRENIKRLIKGEEKKL